MMKHWRCKWNIYIFRSLLTRTYYFSFKYMMIMIILHVFLCQYWVTECFVLNASIKIFMFEMIIPLSNYSIYVSINMHVGISNEMHQTKYSIISIKKNLRWQSIRVVRIWFWKPMCYVHFRNINVYIPSAKWWNIENVNEIYIFPVAVN